MLYFLTAGKKALEDGGVTKDVMKELDTTKCGVIIGSALGGMKVSLRFLKANQRIFGKRKLWQSVDMGFTKSGF